MNTRHLPKGHTMSNIDRVAEVIESSLRGVVEVALVATDGTAAVGFGTELGDRIGEEASTLAQALAAAGRLRPDPSSRYDGGYETTFSRDEDAEDGPHIEAIVDMHRLAPEWEIVHRAIVSIDIGGEHGYHNLHAFATAEWCREAAAVLLDVADEVDRKNKETTEEEQA